MTLEKNEKSYPNTVNYAIFGMLIGFVFPIAATLFDVRLQDIELSIESIIQVQRLNHLHWIIDTAPFVLTSFSAFAGYLKDQTIHINQGLEETVKERTENLENKNELLTYEIEQRKQTEKKLFEAKELAEAGARAKTQFLSTMSHEIRTPLNAIIGMSDLITDTSLTNEQQYFISTINTSSENLLGIINNILDYAKIESGKLDLEEHEFSVAYLIEDVLDIVSASELGKNIELIYKIDESVPDHVIGDSTRIQQILVNLVRNSLKFTEEGEVIISVTLKEGNDKRVELDFEVADTGIGIPEDKLKTLFKSFSQVDSSTTRKFGGTGLGLAICKRLVELMSGEINVKSEYGSGSSFKFTLNLKSSSRKLERVKIESFEGKKVFILDDNDTNLLILQRQCEKAGMKVTAYKDPQKVYDSAKEMGGFDFGILDMHMPEMNGLEVAKAIREHHSKTKLPLVLLSSIMDLNNNEDRKNFNLYLTKPIKQTHLFHNLERVFSDPSISLRTKDKETPSTYGADRNLKILLVEDNTINQIVATKILERLGLKCDIAGNGLEAVEMCKLIDYELVLMDMEMPEMDGITATKELYRIEEELKKMPTIIAMTANAMEEDRKRCLDAGMHDFISKPVKIEDLKAKLLSWFPA